MVERLGAPQPTFSLPLLSEIPDEEEDKATDGKLIV
jgi:D-arabinose 1-dehydrogenase